MNQTDFITDQPGNSQESNQTNINQTAANQTTVSTTNGTTIKTDPDVIITMKLSTEE